MLLELAFVDVKFLLGYCKEMLSQAINKTDMGEESFAFLKQVWRRNIETLIILKA